MNVNSKTIKSKLHEEGYKFTRQRQAVFESILANKEKHLSCDNIFEIIKVDYPEIGIATVYRTLQLFEKMNIVDRVDFDDGFSRYELNMNSDKDNHHHLICLDCGKVMEFKLDLLESLEDDIERSGQFKIVDHNIKFYGYCEDCQK